MTSNPEQTSLHLLLPGLFGPQSGSWPEPGMVHGLTLPHLQKLLSHANRHRMAGDSFYPTLLTLFGLSTENSPIGAICRLGDGGEADGACWLRADPVYFRADRDRLLLFEGRFLDIERHEADHYAELFNEHFADEGWHLEPLKCHRWYLRAPEKPAVELPPLSEVSGRSIDQFLPRDHNGNPFFRFLNEIQMLFHQANPTQMRASRGAASVNGLWLWGGGKLDEVPYTRFQRVISDEPLSKGLAKLALIPFMSVEAGDEALLSATGESLWVDEQLHEALLTDDGAVWHHAMLELDQRIDQLLNMLQEKRTGSLTIYPCNGSSFQLKRGDLRRFWRRNRPLSDWIVE